MEWYRQSVFLITFINNTFITITNAVEIHIIAVFKEKQAEPGIERVDGNNKQYTNYPSLLTWLVIVLQVSVYLQHPDRIISKSCINAGADIKYKSLSSQKFRKNIN